MSERSLMQRLGAWLFATPAPRGAAVKQRAVRAYQGARPTRMTGGFGSSGNTSADAELSSGLPLLRARSRQMLRDSNYAKRARAIVVNNVIGSGIGMQAQVQTTRGVVSERINAAIEREWERWCAAQACHTGGAMHFSDLERALLGEVFEAGDVLVREHPRAFGDSRVPMALELIESERLPDGVAADPAAVNPGNEMRLGVEVDGRFKRAQAFWVREGHPGDIRSRVGESADRYERVPAEWVTHLRVVARWPQTRGEPWLHTALTKLNDMNEYSALELQAARGSAAYFATITSGEEVAPMETDTEEGTEKSVVDIEPMTIQELAPGEKLDFHAPNRPNTALDPFMRAMLREVAAGIGTSYESLSRDYSQSNYSSSRLSLLDDRDTWKTLQQWWVRSFRLPLHRKWLRQAVLAGAIPEISIEQYLLDPEKFEAVKFKCRGWSWVDPTREVEAYKEAIRAGLISTGDVIDQTANGMDIEDVVAGIKRDNDLFAANGIKRDTEVPEPVAKQPAAAAPAKPNEDEPASAEEGDRRRVVNLVRH
jgi:lambda family phage portal protein